MTLPGASKPPAILLGGGPTALTVARSLDRAGVEVYGVGPRSEPLRTSRRRRAFVEIEMDDDFQPRCLEWLGEGPGEGVLMPCSDEGIELVARERSRLATLGYTPFEAADDVLMGMLDKERSYELAREAGIEAPRTAAVASTEEALAAAGEIGYPCALKPRHSHRFARRLQGKAMVVSDERDLVASLSQTLDLGLEMIVTEIIPGPDSGFVSYYSYIDENGQPLLHVTKRKLRQCPTHFGVGSYHVTEWLPEVAELGLRFLQGVGVRGYAGPEFKRDARDGRLKLIECNHRFTTITVHFVLAGADLPLFVYNRLAGLPTPEIGSYREGLGLWLPLADIRALREYRRAGELSLAAWAKTLLRPQRFSAASLTDPGPSLMDGVRKMRRVPSLLRSG